MQFLKVGLVIIVGLFVMDRICLRLEQKGWIYYRYNKPSGGSGAGNALQELNAMLNPSSRHVIELKQKDVKVRDDQGDTKNNI